MLHIPYYKYTSRITPKVYRSHPRIYNDNLLYWMKIIMDDRKIPQIRSALNIREPFIFTKRAQTRNISHITDIMPVSILDDSDSDDEQAFITNMSLNTISQPLFQITSGRKLTSFGIFKSLSLWLEETQHLSAKE